MPGQPHNASPTPSWRRIEVGIKEAHIGFGCRNAILPLAKAVAFVGKDHVFNRHLIGLDRGHEFIALDFEDARIVGALHDEQRLDDVVGVEKR